MDEASAEEKYLEDINRCKRIGWLLEKKVLENFFTQRRAAKSFAERIDCSESRSAGYVYRYLKGLFAQDVSSCGASGRKFRKRYLTRLAQFYTLLEVKADEELVGLIREVNFEFTYPLCDS